MIFELDNVELSFSGKDVLYGVYIKAETGKITGILGSNGCGKTSLLRIFFGNLKCNNKLVRIDQKSTLKDLYTFEKVKFLPQNDLLPNNISLNRLFRIYKVSWSGFLSKFPDFKNYRKSKMSELSGGEKRVISIWLTLKSDSNLILLDEPFTHLSPLNIEIIKKELVLEKKNKAIILTDHLYRHLLEITDDLYFIQDGCSKEIKDPEKLKEIGYAVF
ncbi:ABC transporter ATP-binding protein [Gramella lutea]|uniref:ABC transporter ATP-binding protein n=1 Tax=Christiangramia lutea TaxID=1607951 RepID=A0A9X1V070_9FLAO|nr:ABC transporter ATP-binding protein [Christiangramia lutea]MCH4821659.1 ABC transporter ATP-binding protein [Christiangramia lutea]